MKRKLCALALCAVALLLGGCQTATTIRLGGNEVTVREADAAIFARLSIPFALPDGAADARYAQLDEDIAQAEFTLAEVRYVCRASRERDALCDEEPDVRLEELITDSLGEPLEIEVRRSEAGQCAARWTVGGAHYCLLAEGNPEPFNATAVTLGRATKAADEAR